MCTAGVTIDVATKVDLAPWGYAPGSSIVTCTDCARIHDQEHAMYVGHKHGYRCAQHALEARQSAIRAQEGHLVPDPDEQLRQEIYQLIRVSRDRGIRQAFIASLVLAPILIAIMFWL